ncbi:hypothetical protein N7457_002244 [Penicillium paradoxum]|uniref:uncharacterized protein n=1 Tax=Penicillium paradoxum TaxID=176176 RepID=UPI0025467E0A|nr:uncharacterized protein N7457_002244 [Penicillium paradoxum]KAJ5787254.1 hypothetical protein N7457_002244 [Penicillium paradoxum]
MPPYRVPAILLSPHTTISPSSIHRSIPTAPLRPQLHHHRPRPPQRPTISCFSTSNPLQAKEQNFYEILDIPTTATPAEIKKKFYALSMRHHPDRNRTDPDASQRFARISAAYNVLGNASKRATYDRDHGFHHAHTSSSQGLSHKHPMGSHSSYAGSRPASGLSKRRTAFYGPPPSFYEQGRYGGTGRQEQGFAAGFSAGSAKHDPKYDPEDWEGFIRRNPLNHFNARGHFRTQAAEDKRRRERRTREGKRRIDEGWVDPEPSKDRTVGRFFICSGILMLTLVVVNVWRAAPNVVEGKKVRKRKEAVS